MKKLLIILLLIITSCVNVINSGDNSTDKDKSGTISYKTFDNTYDKITDFKDMDVTDKGDFVLTGYYSDEEGGAHESFTVISSDGYAKVVTNLEVNTFTNAILYDSSDNSAVVAGQWQGKYAYAAKYNVSTGKRLWYSTFGTTITNRYYNFNDVAKAGDQYVFVGSGSLNYAFEVRYITSLNNDGSGGSMALQQTEDVIGNSLYSSVDYLDGTIVAVGGFNKPEDDETTTYSYYLDTFTSSGTGSNGNFNLDFGNKSCIGLSLVKMISSSTFYILGNLADSNNLKDSDITQSFIAKVDNGKIAWILILDQGNLEWADFASLDVYNNKIVIGGYGTKSGQYSSLLYKIIDNGSSASYDKKEITDCKTISEQGRCEIHSVKFLQDGVHIAAAGTKDFKGWLMIK